MKFNNRKLERRLMGECVGAITWETDPDSEFLKTEEINAAKSSITALSDPFSDVDDSFSAVNTEAEIAFSYEGKYPIVDKSREISGTIHNIGLSLIDLLSSINNTGVAHQKNEASQFYIKVKEKLIELYNKVHTAANTYNNVKIEIKRNEYISYTVLPNGSNYTEMANKAASLYPTISVSPSDPFDSGLGTLLSIPAAYQSNLDDGAFEAAVSEYNEVASTKGNKAEEYLRKRGITVAEITSQRYTYSRVSVESAGLDPKYEGHGDVHYYGTIQPLGEDGQPLLDSSGNPLTLDIYYDADEHNPTYYGSGLNTLDASRLYVVIDGEKCYLTNTQYTQSYNDTGGVGMDPTTQEYLSGTSYHYDISIAVNSDGSPVDPTSYQAYNNQGNWSDTVYAHTPSGEVMSFDWNTMQYPGLQTDDDNE